MALAAEVVYNVLHYAERAYYRAVNPPEQEGYDGQQDYYREIDGEDGLERLQRGQEREPLVRGPREVEKQQCDAGKNCRCDNDPDFS